MADESNSENGKVFCRYCHGELIRKLNEPVKVCCHCGNDQRKWVNYIKLSSSVTAILMVLIAASQMINARGQLKISQEQVNETKLKRIEAKEILDKAQNTFNIVSTNTYEMKAKTSNMLKTASIAVDKSFDVLKKAETNAAIAKTLTDRTEIDLRNTKTSFHKLAVALTEPVSTSLAIGSNPFIYQPKKSKIAQIEKIQESLRKLGLSENEIKEAIAPFVLKVYHDHVERILYTLNTSLPNNKKIFKDNLTVEETEKWNIKRLRNFLSENDIEPEGELKETILDYEYYDKHHKLRREGVWQD